MLALFMTIVMLMEKLHCNCVLSSVKRVKIIHQKCTLGFK